MHKHEQLLKLENIGLSFPTRYFKPQSLKEVFIQTLLGPFSKKHMRENKAILKSISFEVKVGDRIGLIGVNGAGKSSLCRIISGIYLPSSGNIKSHGKVRALFESGLMLYPELSGRENAKVLCEIYFPEFANEHEEIINESITFSELGEYIDAPIKTYSNGMLVRLTLSLLSARPAEILILDEVFDGADEFFREKLNARVRSMIDQSGAVIFVSHYQNQIETICNRAILLVNGNLVFDGSIANAFENYRK